jgi:hypothetical protein
MAMVSFICKAVVSLFRLLIVCQAILAAVLTSVNTERLPQKPVFFATTRVPSEKPWFYLEKVQKMAEMVANFG